MMSSATSDGMDKGWIHPALYKWFRLVVLVFSLYTWTPYCQFKHHSLPEMVASIRIKFHITNIRWSQTGFMNMMMSSLYYNGLHNHHINTIEHLWEVPPQKICIMDEKPANLQQLREAIMSIWTKVSEECFEHLLDSVPWRSKSFLKAKKDPTH